MTAQDQEWIRCAIQAPQPEDTTGIPCRSALPIGTERRGPNVSTMSAEHDRFVVTGESPDARCPVLTRGDHARAASVERGAPNGSPVTLKHHLGRPASDGPDRGGPIVRRRHDT